MEEKQVKTGIDRFLELVNSSEELPVSLASRKLNVPEATIELWTEVLRQDGQVDLKYDNFGKMIVLSVKQEQTAEEPIPGPSRAAPSQAAPAPPPRKTLLSFAMRSKNMLLKKYSKILQKKEETAVPPKESLVSRIRGALARPFRGRAHEPKGAVPENDKLDDIRKRLVMLKRQAK